MLSVLVPTYNYNAFTLIKKVHEQLEKIGIEFEIICLDDASKKLFTDNEKINSLNNCHFIPLNFNIGRSKIRNLLAKKAKYDWLLFLDADVLPKDNNFISKYLPYLNEEIKIVNGGILYQEEKPEQIKLLRWLYGKSRESIAPEERKKSPYLRLLTLNFLIHKSIFEVVSFNETIPNLRHEDTLFSYNLMQKRIKVLHIDNPIYHLGLDPFEKALNKENESLIALKYLIDKQLISPNYVSISNLYIKIKNLKLRFVLVFFHKITNKFLIKNLSGTHPSLFIFDLYRLGYLCSIDVK